MKYMIMLFASQQQVDAMWGKSSTLPAWTPEQLAAMGQFMQNFHQELSDSGELVEAHGLDAPVHTRRIKLTGGQAVMTDGPYAETQEVLAGYTIIDVDSFDRATEIAARMTKCPPGPDGGEGSYLDVRPILDGRDDLQV